MQGLPWEKPKASRHPCSLPELPVGKYHFLIQVGCSCLSQENSRTYVIVLLILLQNIPHTWGLCIFALECLPVFLFWNSMPFLIQPPPVHFYDLLFHLKSRLLKLPDFLRFYKIYSNIIYYLFNFVLVCVYGFVFIYLDYTPFLLQF